MPAASVVMVFHRDTPFLRPAIASVMGQTLRDFELVLVDNGTGLPADELGEMGRDPRLRWVRLPRNLGVSGGHNAGVAAAQGEIIVLLDSDDIALPARIERQVAALRANPRLGLVSSLAERINEQGMMTEREFSLVEEEAQRIYTQYAAPVVMPAYAGRREVFEELPYRVEFFHTPDYDFITRAAERWPMAAVPEVLLQYRWHPGQTTQTHAVVIEETRAMVRLITARRRAGRAEDLGSLLPHAGQADGGAAEICRRYAGRCLKERFAPLAAYHARRSFVLERTAAALAKSGRLALRALAVAAPHERMLVARMFFTGPVRALGLRPA